MPRFLRKFLKSLKNLLCFSERSLILKTGDMRLTTTSGTIYILRKLKKNSKNKPYYKVLRHYTRGEKHCEILFNWAQISQLELGETVLFFGEQPKNPYGTPLKPCFDGSYSIVKTIEHG